METTATQEAQEAAIAATEEASTGDAAIAPPPESVTTDAVVTEAAVAAAAAAAVAEDVAHASPSPATLQEMVPDQPLMQPQEEPEPQQELPQPQPHEEPPPHEEATQVPVPQPVQPPPQETQPPPPPQPPTVDVKQDQPSAGGATTNKIQWECQLLFNEADKGEEERLRDICPYLTSVPFIKGYPPKTSYRFPARFKGMDKANDLVKEICRGGARSGYTLIKRSSETKSSKIRTMTVRLACNRHVVKERKKAIKPPADTAGDPMSPEQLLASQQPPPKKRQRKAATVRPATMADRCPFNFTIFLAANDDFWYLSHRDALSGDDPVTNFCTHVGHHRNDPVVGATVATSAALPASYGNMTPMSSNGQPIQQVVMNDSVQVQTAMKVVKNTVDLIADDKEEFDTYMKQLEELHNGVVAKKSDAVKQGLDGVVTKQEMEVVVTKQEMEAVV